MPLSEILLQFFSLCHINGAGVLDYKKKFVHSNVKPEISEIFSDTIILSSNLPASHNLSIIKAFSDKKCNSRICILNTFDILRMNFCGQLFLGSITPKTPDIDSSDEFTFQNQLTSIMLVMATEQHLHTIISFLAYP